MDASSAPPPFEARVDPEEGLGTVRFAGRVTGADMWAGAATLFALSEWEDSFDVIWDCSRVEAHIMGPEEMQPLVDEVTEHGLGHDALVESQVAADDMVGDLLVRFIRRRGKSASSHANMEGALRSLNRESLPPSLVW